MVFVIVLLITVITDHKKMEPYRSPKKIAEAMGHEYETHLLSYARFDSKDLAKSFDQQPISNE